MADKQISELAQVGALDTDALFVVQQGGAAYSATGAQVQGLLPGSGGGRPGGGDSTYYLDLTGQVEVNSLPETAEENDQRWSVEINGAALAHHSGPVAVRFLDSQFPDEVMTVNATNRRLIPGAGDGDVYLILHFAHTNPGSGTPADAEMRLTKSGEGYTAKFYYGPYAETQADFEMEDTWDPAHIDNNPIKVQNGFTYINKTPKPTAFNWSGLTCSVPMDDGSTHSIAINTDASGAVTGITIDGHTAPITGVS